MHRAYEAHEKSAYGSVAGGPTLPGGNETKQKDMNAKTDLDNGWPSHGRLLKSDASPPACDGHAREKDAGSVNSSAICATEDVLSRRQVRSGGRGFAFQQPRLFRRRGHALEPRLAFGKSVGHRD